MTTFTSPPPIEDLGDIAWKRVEQGLMARLEAEQPAYVVETVRSRRTAWVAGGLALVSAAALALVIWAVRDGEQRELPALVHAQISELATQESSTQLELLGAKVDVAAHSAISVEQGDNRLRIDLRAGSVRLKVAKRDDMREPVAVVAGDVRVEVMGTEFAVYRHAEGTKVEVFEGVVRVTSQGERTLVNAGETWPAEEVAQNQAAKKTRAKRVRQSDRKDSSAQAPAVKSSASELFAEAQALEVSDPDRAIELYRRAAKGTGAWAANALFAAARLELARGHIRVGNALLKSYAKQFPQGANIADVESLLAN